MGRTDIVACAASGGVDFLRLGSQSGNRPSGGRKARSVTGSPARTVPPPRRPPLWC